MNLGDLVKWGRQTLALLDDPSPLQRLGLSLEQVHAKLGWLAEFRDDLTKWSAYHGVIEGVLDFVRCRGYYRERERIWRPRCPSRPETRQRVAAAVDRICNGRVVESPDRRGCAGDDRGA